MPSLVDICQLKMHKHYGAPKDVGRACRNFTGCINFSELHIWQAMCSTSTPEIEKYLLAVFLLYDTRFNVSNIFCMPYVQNFAFHNVEYMCSLQRQLCKNSVARWWVSLAPGLRQCDMLSPAYVWWNICTLLQLQYSNQYLHHLL